MTGMPLSRRALIGAALGVAVGALAGCRSGPPPGTTAFAGTLRSVHWPGRDVRWRLLVPTGVSAPRLVVALHGYGGNADDYFDSVGIGDHVVRTGLAVATIDGGNSYWHARRDGTDTGAMVMADFVPMLRRDHAVSSRPIGLTGLSMGGYGALWLTESAPPGVVGAVAVMSAALWTSPGASAPGAFDDREDFLAHDVFTRTAALRHSPLRLDCGTSDPFFRADTAFVDRVSRADGHFAPGGHSTDFWHAHVGAQMDHLARHLVG